MGAASMQEPFLFLSSNLLQAWHTLSDTLRRCKNKNKIYNKEIQQIQPV